jgi:hypothetical protein
MQIFKWVCRGVLKEIRGLLKLTENKKLHKNSEKIWWNEKKVITLHSQTGD